MYTGYPCLAQGSSVKITCAAPCCLPLRCEDGNLARPWSCSRSAEQANVLEQETKGTGSNGAEREDLRELERGLLRGRELPRYREEHAEALEIETAQNATTKMRNPALKNCYSKPFVRARPSQHEKTQRRGSPSGHLSSASQTRRPKRYRDVAPGAIQTRRPGMHTPTTTRRKNGQQRLV